MLTTYHRPKSKKVVLLCILTFYSFVNSIIGQHSKSDWLSRSDSITLQIYRQQVVRLINPQPDSALFYIEKIRSLSEAKNYQIGLADTDYTMGHYFRRVQQMDSAISYYEKALSISKKINYSSGIARALNALCRGYYIVGKPDDAKKACEECLAVADQEQDLHIIVDTYTALGNTYMRENNFKKAVGYFLKADSVHSKTPQRPDIIAASYQSLGNVYKELADYPKSIEFYQKANLEFKKLPINTDYFVNNTNMQLGTVEYLNKNIRTADSLLIIAYSYFKEIKDENALAQTSTYLGLTKLEQGIPDEAEKLLNEGYMLNRDNNFSYETTEARLKLAELYLKNNNTNKAIEHLEGTLKNNKESNMAIEAAALEQLAKAYFLKGSNGKAYITLKRAKKIKDSIAVVQNQASIRELETIYETEKKEQEIALLKSQNLLTEQRQKSQKNLLLAGIGFTSIAGLFLFFLYRNRQKTNKKLRELDLVKSNFFTNISHELRTPLSLIKGPVEEELNQINLTEKSQHNLKIAKKNSERLEVLVDQILDISKLESGQYQLKVSHNNLEEFLKSIVSSFEFKTQQKNQTFDHQYKFDQPMGWFDPDIVQKITANLIDNAIKYSPDKAHVSIEFLSVSNYLNFDVINSGVSLADTELINIFNRFYRTNEDQTGTGIGLALTKELVELHKGKIFAKSVGNSVKFSVKLPIDETAFTNDEKSKTINRLDFKRLVADESESFISLDKKIEKDLPILLVVEDNDDLRSYVTSLFEQNFQVLTARDGREGFKTAQKNIPDIIITDLMMPGDDGFKLTKNCKTEDTTSHIPIIMLTAKSGDENQLIGLETGADAYITKPFHTEILKQKVRNLLETQKKLQERFSKEVILTPKDIAISSYDQRFLENLQEVMDSHLIESDFSAEKFALALGMSRMQLHRKLKALTGLSTTEFIRSQRLKLAAQLLKESDVNVSEVGYTVGFNNHSYFTKCFKEQFGVSPTTYSKK